MDEKVENQLKMRRKNQNQWRTLWNKGADVYNAGIKNYVNKWFYFFPWSFFFHLLLLKFVMRMFCVAKVKKEENYSTGIIKRNYHLYFVVCFLFFDKCCMNNGYNGSSPSKDMHTKIMSSRKMSIKLHILRFFKVCQPNIFRENKWTI